MTPAVRSARRFVVALLALAALAARAAAAQERVERRRALDPGGSLRIYNLYGSIRVIGWDRDTVALSGTLSRGERLLFGGSRGGLKLGVETEEERTERGAHLVIHVPAGARVWVKTASAETSVTGVTGGLDLYSVGASLRVAGSPRELTAETMDGAVEVTGSPAWMRAKTATGAITLRGGSADLGLTTVSGPVRVSGGALRRVRVESVTGDVEIDAPLERDGGVDVDTHAGRVALTLPPGADAEFHVTTIGGTIDNGITTARPAADRGRGKRELHFATDAAAARVTIRTFKGAVVLRRR